MKKYFALLWISLLGFACSAQGQAAAPFKLLQKIPMPNVKGRLDHFGVDLKGKRLFVAALGDNQNTVEVINLKTGKWVSSIPGQSKPQGLFYSPDFKKLFVANGTDGTCKIFTGDKFKLGWRSSTRAPTNMSPTSRPMPAPAASRSKNRSRKLSSRLPALPILAWLT